jgi:iron complex outermembrane recepter protein
MSSSNIRLGVVAALMSTPLAVSAAPSDAAGGLEEIVVTAQKREEKLSDIPMSITALSGSDLQGMAATQFRDFANTVPGLSFTTAGAGDTQVNLRGIATGGNVSPTVGIYVDEVPYGSTTPFAAGAQLALDVGLFDLQRVEVLRGPQGTLYGASTMGGLLKYVPMAPNLEGFGGNARVGVSSTDQGGTSYDVASVVNAPLSAGKSAVRLSGFYSRDGGYIDDIQQGNDDVNQTDVYGGRADFLLQASDKLSVRFAVYAQKIERDGSIAADYDLTGKPIAGELEQANALPESFEQKFSLVSGTVKYAMNFAELTSITSYQSSDVDNSSDLSDFYVPALAPALAPLGIELAAVGIDKQIGTDKFTQEFRLGATGETIDWLVGAFYTNEDSDQHQVVPSYDPSGAVLPLNIFTIALPSKYEEIAGFTTLTWHATDKLDLTGGLRYAHNSQEQEQIGSSDIGLTGSIPKRESSEDVTTYLANLRYRINDHVMPYLRVASGYRPGGPNVVLNDPDTGLPIAPPTFDSDSLTSYEAGLKASTEDRRYTIDVAAYYIDWKDLQIVAVRNNVGVIANASKARSQGAELTLTAIPVDALTLVGAFGYMDAELSEASADLGGAKGESLPNTPKFTATVSADYDFDLGGRDGSAGATYRIVDERTSSFEASDSLPPYELPDYQVVDLRGSLRFGAANVQLYMKNVFDERGQLSVYTGQTLLGGPANVSILQPRTYGLSVNFDF